MLISMNSLKITNSGGSGFLAFSLMHDKKFLKNEKTKMYSFVFVTENFLVLFSIALSFFLSLEKRPFSMSHIIKIAFKFFFQ